MKIRKKYTPIYRDATALLRPKTGPQRHGDRSSTRATRRPGAIPEGGTLPVAQTQPAVQLDEFLAGLDADTRDYLKLLRRRRGRGPQRQRRGARRDAQALRSDGALPEADQPPARQARQGDLALDPQLPELSEALGDKDAQLARFVDSSNKVFQDFASEQASLRRRCGCCRTRSSRPTSALAKSARAVGRRRPDAHRAAADGERPRAGAQGLPELRAGDDADVQEPAAAVRAGRRAVGRALKPGGDRPRRVAAGPDRLARRPQLALQRHRLQPVRQGGGLPLLARLGEPPRRRDLQRRRRARPDPPRPAVQQLRLADALPA